MQYDYIHTHFSLHLTPPPYHPIHLPFQLMPSFSLLPPPPSSRYRLSPVPASVQGVGQALGYGNPISSHNLKEYINPGFKRLKTTALNRVANKPAGETTDKEGSCVAAERGGGWSDSTLSQGRPESNQSCQA